jgi:AmmeMemoRadiSam system protein B/AmmeMemoRadiSam system protein A
MIPTGSDEHDIRIRPAAKAGSWYEGNPEALEKQLVRFFNKADPPKVEGRVRALISPHAGYVYSGQTAAYGGKLVEGAPYKRVIVLAPSHYARFEGGSIMDVTHYETPLGRIPLDREACDALLKTDYFTSVSMAHTQEHSLELQLPIIQHALEGEFTLIPIVIGNIRTSWYEPMTRLLLDYWDDETLVVASSDFTHYGANFGYVPFRKNVPENLEKLDMGAIDKILELDSRGFTDYVAETAATICGRKPIALLLSLAREKKMKAHLLHYTTSGAMGGDYSTSVSYASICFTGEKVSGAGLDESSDLSHPLTEEEKQTLLRLARHTLKTFLDTGRAPADLSNFEITDALKQELGAFVTLKIKGRLRGCIGYLKGMGPLYKAVIDNTISAASKDPRFPPVRSREEKSIHMEISVLSPVKRVKDLEEIQVGRDGLIISKGFRRGTLLPQVPTEYGWSRTQFLEHTCQKAGLPSDAYKDPETRIERYSAQVFGEAK